MCDLEQFTQNHKASLLIYKTNRICYKVDERIKWLNEYTEQAFIKISFYYHHHYYFYYHYCLKAHYLLCGRDAKNIISFIHSSYALVLYNTYIYLPRVLIDFKCFLYKLYSHRKVCILNYIKSNPRLE